MAFWYQYCAVSAFFQLPGLCIGAAQRIKGLIMARSGPLLNHSAAPSKSITPPLPRYYARPICLGALINSARAPCGAIQGLTAHFGGKRAPMESRPGPYRCADSPAAASMMTSGKATFLNSVCMKACLFSPYSSSMRLSPCVGASIPSRLAGRCQYAVNGKFEGMTTLCLQNRPNESPLSAMPA